MRSLELQKISFTRIEKLETEISLKNSEIIVFEGKLRQLENEIKRLIEEKTSLKNQNNILSQNLTLIENLLKNDFDDLNKENINEEKKSLMKEIKYLKIELENSQNIIENLETNKLESENKLLDYSDVILNNQEIIGLLQKELTEIKRKFENMKDVISFILILLFAKFIIFFIFFYYLIYFELNIE